MKIAAAVLLLAASPAAATPAGLRPLAGVTFAPSAISVAGMPVAPLFTAALMPIALPAAPPAPLLKAPETAPAARGESVAPQALPETGELERLKALAPALAAAEGGLDLQDDAVRRLYEGAVPADADSLPGGLSKEHLELIRRHSKGGRPMGMDEFLATVPLERNGYILGTTGGHIYDAAAEATGLTHYQEVYGELYGKIRVDATDQFMDSLTRSGDPIVFLVPDRALTHPEAKMTKEELEWLFAHPERMKDVYFVFGAYNVAGAGRTEEQLTESFAARRGALARPADATRLAQRRRHLAGYDVRELHGDERLAGIEEFVGELRIARMVRDRLGAGKLYFASDRGYYVLQRSARGLFLTLPALPGDARERELFISKTQEPELFAASSTKIALAN